MITRLAAVALLALPVTACGAAPTKVAAPMAAAGAQASAFERIKGTVGPEPGGYFMNYSDFLTLEMEAKSLVGTGYGAIYTVAPKGAAKTFGSPIYLGADGTLYVCHVDQKADFRRPAGAFYAIGTYTKADALKPTAALTFKLAKGVDPDVKIKGISKAGGFNTEIVLKIAKLEAADAKAPALIPVE